MVTQKLISRLHSVLVICILTESESCWCFLLLLPSCHRYGSRKSGLSSHIRKTVCVFKVWGLGFRSIGSRVQFKAEGRSMPLSSAPPPDLARPAHYRCPAGRHCSSRRPNTCRPAQSLCASFAITEPCRVAMKSDIKDNGNTNTNFAY